MFFEGRSIWPARGTLKLSVGGRLGFCLVCEQSLQIEVFHSVAKPDDRDDTDTAAGLFFDQLLAFSHFPIVPAVCARIPQKQITVHKKCECACGRRETAKTQHAMAAVWGAIFFATFAVPAVCAHLCRGLLEVFVGNRVCLWCAHDCSKTEFCNVYKFEGVRANYLAPDCCLVEVVCEFRVPAVVCGPSSQSVVVCCQQEFECACGVRDKRFN